METRWKYFSAVVLAMKNALYAVIFIKKLVKIVIGALLRMSLIKNRWNSCWLVIPSIWSLNDSILICDWIPIMSTRFSRGWQVPEPLNFGCRPGHLAKRSEVINPSPDALAMPTWRTVFIRYLFSEPCFLAPCFSEPCFLAPCFLAPCFLAPCSLEPCFRYHLF